MRDLHRARHNKRHDSPFCEFQQDLKQVEDALRSEDAMDASLQDRRGGLEGKAIERT